MMSVTEGVRETKCDPTTGPFEFTTRAECPHQSGRKDRR